MAEGLNTLATGTLVTENLKNSASYKASQVGISGRYGWGGSGGKDGGKDAGLGTDAKGNGAGDSKAQPGTSVPQTSGGLGMGTPVVAAASGRDSSTTYSAISGGIVVIRDEVAQQNLSGMTAAETIASLNRDTSSDTLNALKPIFDKEKIEAGFEIVAESQRQVGQFLTNRAKEIDSAKRRSEDPCLPYAERVQAAKEYADLESKWGAQGRYSQWGTIILGAASGNVMGGTGQFVQAATVNYLQTLGAAQIKELSRELGGEGSVGHAALHAVLGCAGAAGQGASCSAGGVGALSGVVLSKLLESVESAKTRGLSTEEMQARVNLISSIVAGVAGAIDPSAATAAQVAARIELENNSFYTNRNQVAQMKVELIDDLLKRCGSNTQCLQAGFEKADRMASAYDVTLTLRRYPQLTKEKADALAQAALDLAPGVSNASALYELMTGKTATGEEANRFFSAIGLVPVVGGMLKKGGQALHVFAEADKAIDVGKIGAKGNLPTKTAVQELEVDSYQNLKAREVVGDGLEHDHIPSFAALRTAKEAELGRPLTDVETKALYQNATAVEVPRDVHVAGPTYGGKNTPAQIQKDAADLCGAVCRDTDALRSNLTSRGYDSKLVDEIVQKIVERNRQTGVIE